MNYMNDMNDMNDKEYCELKKMAICTYMRMNQELYLLNQRLLPIKFLFLNNHIYILFHNLFCYFYN